MDAHTDLGQLGALQPDGNRGWQRQRIDAHVVENDLEVKVRPGSDPRLTDEADPLSASHPIPCAQARSEAEQMRIGGLQAAVVPDEKISAVVPAPTDVLDDPCRGGDHRRTERRAEIDALVKAPISERGVKARSVGGGDRSTRHGLPEVEQRDARAVVMNERELAVSCLVAMNPMELLSVVDRGRAEPHVVDAAAFGRSLVHDREASVARQHAGQIGIELKRRDDTPDQHGRYLRAAERMREAPAHDANHLPKDRVGVFSRYESHASIVAEAEGQVPGVPGLETKRADPGAYRAAFDRQSHAIAGRQAALIEEVAESSQQRVAVLLVDSFALEDPEDGVAPLDRDIDRAQRGASRQGNRGCPKGRGERDSEAGSQDQAPSAARDSPRRELPTHASASANRTCSRVRLLTLPGGGDSAAPARVGYPIRCHASRVRAPRRDSSQG